MIDEVYKRTLNQWTVSGAEYPANTSAPVLVLATLSSLSSPEEAERYTQSTCGSKALDLYEQAGEEDAARQLHRFHSSPDAFQWCAQSGDGSGRTGPVVYVTGNTESGLLFGLGQLLLHLNLSYVASYKQPYAATITIASGAQLTSAPAYDMRGQMFEFRSISDAYDAWTVPEMLQYVRDSALFGCNQIELGAPDGAPDPLFVVSPERMIQAVSEYTQALHLRFSLWWPLTASGAPTGAALFATMPHLTSLFMPGGDGGPYHPPAAFFEYAAAQAQLVQRYFPTIEIWVSAQGWNDTQMTEFYDTLHTQPLEWLTGGIVYSPHQVPVIGIERGGKWLSVLRS